MVRHTQAFEARARGRVAGGPRPGGGQLQVQVQPLSPTRLLTRTATRVGACRAVEDWGSNSSSHSQGRARGLGRSRCALGAFKIVSINFPL